jgi:hypothetical protein
VEEEKEKETRRRRRAEENVRERKRRVRRVLSLPRYLLLQLLTVPLNHIAGYEVANFAEAETPLTFI